jgi:exonuclease III
MKLLAWNILHGGGPDRLPWIVLALLEWAPEIITLTEFRSARGGSLRGVLADHGWAHQGVSGAGAGENGVLIASKLPIARLDTHPGLPPPLRRRILTGEFEGGLSVTAVHVPDAARHDRPAMVEKTAVWHELIRTARARGSGSHAILGDLNTGRHRLDEAGASFSCTALLGRVVSLGYRDAWRSVHGSRRAGSWISPSGGSFRIDHALVSPALAGRVRGAEYGSAGLGEGLSDHASLVVELGPAAREA